MPGRLPSLRGPPRRPSITSKILKLVDTSRGSRRCRCRCHRPTHFDEFVIKKLIKRNPGRWADFFPRAPYRRRRRRHCIHSHTLCVSPGSLSRLDFNDTNPSPAPPSHSVGLSAIRFSSFVPRHIPSVDRRWHNCLWSIS